MSTNYVSLALSDTMFPEGQFKKDILLLQEAQERLEINRHNIVSAANPSHKATFNALSRRFGIDLPVPDKAPEIALQSGDRILVFQAKLPRLAEGQVHSQETVDSAEFKFSLWTIL